MHQQKGLENRALYETVVKHRNSFTRMGGVDYNFHNPQSINFIPSNDYLAQWENDYTIMREQMIHGQSPSFKDLIDSLSVLNKQINAFDWKMETTF